MANLNKTKRRIHSVNYTKKITSAMELVSTIKLKRYKNAMLSFGEYVNELYSFMFRLIDGEISKKTREEFVNEKKADKCLVVVISSNLGLCSSYNQEIIKYVTNNISKKNNKLMLIGNKAYRPLESLGYEIDNRFLDINENLTLSKVRILGYTLLTEFFEGKYKGIKVLFTHFVNSIKFTPKMSNLLPLTRKTKDEYYDLSYKPIYDSDPETLIKEIAPLFISSRLYNMLIDSEVSEHASRRNAMEAATDNADELIEKLTLEYNKARQANITQEITEVISGTLK